MASTMRVVVNEGGRDMWLRVAELKVDHRYQRSLREAQVARMAAAWNPDLAGACEVSHRADGSYVVLDGQQRMVAARRAHVEYLRCIVHEGLSLADEAARFVALNTQRSRPKALELFHGRLEAGDPIALAVKATMEEAGASIARFDIPKRPYGQIAAVANCEAIYRAGGRDLLRRTIVVCMSAWPGDPVGLKSTLLTGVASFLRAYSTHPLFKEDRLLSKLASRPSRYVDQRGLVLATGQGTSTAEALGWPGHRKAILELYNHGLQFRLPDAAQGDLRRIALGQNPWITDGGS